MAADFEVKVTGIPDMRAALARVPQVLRRRVLRNALAAGGRVFQRAARRLAPVLKLPIRNGAGSVIRQPGTLRKAISVRTSKLASRRGNVGVFINVKPLRGAGRTGPGSKNPKDPYYWRWMEFGFNAAGKRTAGRGAAGKSYRRYANRAVGFKKTEGFAFLRGAAKRTAEALGAIVAALGPAVDRALRNLSKARP